MQWPHQKWQLFAVGLLAPFRLPSLLHLFLTSACVVAITRPWPVFAFVFEKFLYMALALAVRVGAQAAGVSVVAMRRSASWRWGLLSAGGLAAVTSAVAAPAICDDGNVGGREGWTGVWVAGAAAAAAAWWLTPRSAASLPEADLLGWQKKWEIKQVLCLPTAHMHAQRRPLTHALTDACTQRAHAHTCTPTHVHRPTSTCSPCTPR